MISQYFILHTQNVRERERWASRKSFLASGRAAKSLSLMKRALFALLAFCRWLGAR